MRIQQKTEDISSRDETPCDRRSISLNMKKMQMMFQIAAEENVSSVRDYVIELKGRAANIIFSDKAAACLPARDII
jgi:centromeric protein E